MSVPLPSKSRTAFHWSILILLSAVMVGVLELLRMPAALLLAPMAAAVIISTRGIAIKVPRHAFFAAQSVVGCLIAHSITPSTLGTVAARWPMFFGTIFAVLIASCFCGWLLARFQVLPGSVAVWGSAPGAASAMTVLAGAHGADMRLVAFMQYLRVVFVALAAALVSGLWAGSSGPPAHAMEWFPDLAWKDVAATLALAAIAGTGGRLLKIPAGGLLGPLIAGAILQGSGIMTITLPPWFLAVSYAIIGWNIGTRFTREILTYVAGALPRVALAIVAQIGFCVGVASLLTRFAGIDPLSAYLATSPGGADSIAIIAASSHVDLSFVMAMQTLRLFLVLLVSPSLARLVARQIDKVIKPATAAP
ncbi:AbrB family transcriptional regulator [Beijerinckia sp. L45]|uniref:AbrB family transcriptional regulator n=1 Tax=Beijerinckia sp. L45 TaxID=1641855 RepID=UPI00131D31C9|nr:AbrB family transcriptional regulator [Beijerinckia sp. L45]